MGRALASYRSLELRELSRFAFVNNDRVFPYLHKAYRVQGRYASKHVLYKQIARVFYFVPCCGMGRTCASEVNTRLYGEEGISVDPLDR